MVFRRKPKTKREIKAKISRLKRESDKIEKELRSWEKKHSKESKFIKETKYFLSRLPDKAEAMWDKKAEIQQLRRLI